MVSISRIYCWQIARLYWFCLIRLIWLNLSKFRSKNLKGSLMSLTRFLFSDKVRCFNQSERALYGNFIIKLVKVPCARALPQKELDPDSRVWKEFCQFPLCFPIPTFGTLNKMAGAKLTNEGTVSPWAFKSEQHPSMLPGTIPCYWDLVWTGPGTELDLQAWDLGFAGKVWYWSIAACRYQCTRITYCTWCTPVKCLCTGTSGD